MTLPTRAELQGESFRALLRRYALLIEDSTLLTMPVEDLAPHGHPINKEDILPVLFRLYRI